MYDPADLVDDPNPHKKASHGGRPANPLLDKILQRCHRTSHPEKKLYHCAGKNCGLTFVNRNLKRAVRHAVGCFRLPKETRRLAKQHAATRAPSKLLENEIAKADGLGVEESGIVATKKRKTAVDEAVPMQNSSRLYDIAKKEGKQIRHRKLDLAVVKLFCVAGLATDISDLNEWKDVLYIADPSYHPPTRARLEEELIIGEAEEIQEKQLAYLRTQENLTVSCDGGTTRNQEAFWTTHISSMERKVYLMEMREATNESHTAVWIKCNVLEVCLTMNRTSLSQFGNDLIFQIIDSIGRSRIAAVVSDSTGNTRLHRELLVKEVPTMLNLPDIIHFISNTIKDIVTLPFFKPTILTIRGVLTKFHKSHLGKSELCAARKHFSIGRGLEKIGKTRFGTIIFTASSVQRNLPAIKRVVEHGKFDLGVSSRRRFIIDSKPCFTGSCLPL